MKKAKQEAKAWKNKKSYIITAPELHRSYQTDNTGQYIITIKHGI